MHPQTTLGAPSHSRAIAEAATKCLQNSPYHAVRGILCECDQGILFLRGHLTCFHQKQVAQETVASIIGVTRVINEIEVG